MGALKNSLIEWWGWSGTRPWLFEKIKTYYYNTKYTIINYFKYAKIISQYRPWDSAYILEMMKFQLTELCHTIEKYGNEVDEYRLPTIVRMKRTIEILEAQIEDTYAKRCGYIDKASKIFIDEKTGEVKLELQPGYENYDETKVFKDANELREKEWNELFDILKNNLGSWWD
jgi:hypothetical protein